MKKILLSFLFLFSISAFSQTVNLDNYGLRVYNVVFYGAVGNDPGDGTGTDDYNAFAAAIAAMPAQGGILYIPAATAGLGYRISTRLTINKNITIIGDGNGCLDLVNAVQTPCRGGTYIFYTRNDNQLFYFTQNAGINEQPTFSMEGVHLKCVSASTPIAGSTGIYVDSNLNNFKLKGITVEGFYININVVAGYCFAIEDFAILNPISVGIVLGNNINSDLGGYDIRNGYIWAGNREPNTSIGVLIKAGAGDFYSVNFNAQNYLDIDTYFERCIVADFSDGATSEIKVTSCDFNNYRTNGFYINAPSSTISEIQLVNCHFAPQNTVTGPGIFIKGSSSHHLTSVTISNISGQNTPGTTAPFIDLAYIDGLAVTGIAPRPLGWTGGDLDIANCTVWSQPMKVQDVNVVSPTSPNRTITVVIDGTTYYIPAKTTNN